MVEIEVLVYFKSSASGEAEERARGGVKQPLGKMQSAPPAPAPQHTHPRLGKRYANFTSDWCFRPFHSLTPLFCTEVWGKLFKFSLLLDLPS